MGAISITLTGGCSRGSPTTEQRNGGARALLARHTVRGCHMAYSLRPGITYTWVGEVPFLLDINRNRYFKLTPRAADALLRLERRGNQKCDDLKLLSSFGILQETHEDSLIQPVLELPSIKKSYFEEPLRTSLKYIAIAAIDQFWSFIAIRCVGLPVAVAQLRKRTQRRPCQRYTPSLAHLIGAYRFVDLFLSAESRCLVRSFGLARSLTRYGITFALAIGVRTGPFGAHCWVQIEDKSLSDNRDKAREYTPIMVL